MSAVAEEGVIRALYQELLDGWNHRSASDMARLFVRDGLAVGFDGTEMQGSSVSHRIVEIR